MALASTRGYGGPLRPGSAADAQRRRPPVGGENAEYLKMAACLIFNGLLKVISSRQVKMPALKGNGHLQMFTPIFRGHARHPDQ
jgi:hypothetical protein